MTDGEESRVLEVSPGRTEESTDLLKVSLEESQRKQLEADGDGHVGFVGFF